MPWFPSPRQAVDGVLVLEACRFVQASSVFDGCLFSRASVDSHDLFFMFEAMVVIVFCVRSGGIESGASIYIWVLSLCASVRVPPIDTLNSSQ